MSRRAAIALSSSLLLAWACPPSTPERGGADLRPLEAPREGFVTSRTCRSCHPSQYATWFGSYHRRMTQVASPDAVIGDFDGVELAVAGERYRLERRGAEFWVAMDRGPGTPAEERPIVLTTGSHHRQWVWFPTGAGRQLATIPFIFLEDERRWVPRSAAFMLPPDPRWVPTRHEGLWGANCVACHNTDGERQGATAAEPRVAEFGIACEACHGPAETHVRANRDPRHRYQSHLSAAPDATVVNPRRLAHTRSAEVCGQCHAISAAAGAFRPGDDLSAVLSGKEWGNPLPEASEWPDGMMHTGGREYEALVDTPCFQEGEMSCLSCHRMHQTADDRRATSEWANDQLAPGMETDEACMQCHRRPSGRNGSPCYDCEQHTHHKPESSGSRCYNCHMPYTSYALLKAIRNHQVVADSVATTLATGRPNACNLCHLDKSLGFTADYLERWYGIVRPELDDDEQRLAASVLWATRGHAGQRALIAWHMGWPPAREASGTVWLGLYLALLMNDPYPAVRLMADRSARDLEAFAGLSFDYVGPAAEREAVLRGVLEGWAARLARRTETGDALLINPDGSLARDEFFRLVGARDSRPVFWIE